MKYGVQITTRFKRDMKRLQKQGKDVEKVFSVVNQIANGYVLESRYKDHALTGNYIGYRECHVENDWVLVYKIEHDILILSLVATGSHAQIFGM